MPDALSDQKMRLLRELALCIFAEQPNDESEALRSLKLSHDMVREMVKALCKQASV